ncbi:hypothetical protein HNP38_001825 [Chryseobacterium defluvii]|uniref:Dolichyl-phosphate-mannose-protein mannosyltransferase n=1 Tax=Chryseobacterium defluvii TaxID=160396 RepID=A0A840KAV3_9FLAO|nr:hypothetical protein [Chryseobacterium defluvii]MBB4806529.1 hypothetical protein [Chryseobacterium defluvii]
MESSLINEGFKKYKILAVIIVGVYFLQTFFLSYGGIGSDSLSYFGIAADLPEPETDLFPLGYPILLQVFHILFNDYFWASKFLNLFFTVFILVFSYSKRFYFRETVLLFMGKTLFFVFTSALSEGPFIFLMYFLFYFFYQIFVGRGNLNKNAVAASLIMIGMFTVRYSGIYIYLAVFLFSLFLSFIRKDRYYSNALLLFLAISGIGIAGYLFFNFQTFGSFTGEQLRGEAGDIAPVYILRDLLGVANTIDPFIGIKPASSSMASIGFQLLILMIDVFVFIYFLRYYRKAKETSLYYFHVLLWIMAGVYAFSLLFSGWFQQIEEMNVRMLAAANFCLFFSFLILYYQYNKDDRWIWRIGCFFLVFLTLYNLKDPGNYLENRNKIKPQMSKFTKKRYLFNNETNVVTVTTYHFPVINKSFKYQHTNSQKGKLKESIAGSLNPKIKWIKKDTVRDKSQVLYTSELSFE